MTKKILCMAAVVALCFSFRMPVLASDPAGEEYITISVDAVDENGELRYALDSDDPSAFTDSNEFVVPAGTSHTIYVKDAAGNISSQVYGAEEEERHEYITAETDDERRINIDLEIGGKQPQADYSEYTDIPVEPGSATVSSKTRTDGSDSAEKVFYTFTTKEGETLYMVIDQGQGTDNVYLLDTVSISDLKVLADGQAASYGSDDKKEDNLLSALASADSQQEESVSQKGAGGSGKTGRSNAFIILIIAAVGGGAYYYLKIYRNKKDEAMDVMDAMDLDEFEVEEDAGEDEIEFDYDDAEKEQYLEQLINEDEDFFDADPEEYATSHMEEEDYDDGIELEGFGEEDEDADINIDEEMDE